MAHTTAQDFLWHDRAGLQLAGQDEDGALLWLGTPQQWQKLGWLEDGVEDRKESMEELMDDNS